MHAAIRPMVTAGVALVGAGVIAVTPVAPGSASDIRIASAAVQLTAAPNPIEFYPQVAITALSNAGTLAQQYVTVPVELVAALVTQPIPTLLSTLRLITEPGPYLFAALSLAAPIISGIGATVVAIAEVVAALFDGNATDFFNAVIDIPARIADGVLNGGYPDASQILLSFGGLLTPFDDSGLFVGIPGPIGIPAMFGQIILNGLPSPIGSARVNEPPAPATETVSMSTDSLVDSGPTTADQAVAEAGSQTAVPGLVTLGEGAAAADTDSLAAEAETGGELVAVESATPEIPDTIADPADGVETKPEHRTGVLQRMRQRLADRVTHADDRVAKTRDHGRVSRAAGGSHRLRSPENS